MKVIMIGTVTVILLVMIAGVCCQQDEKEKGKGFNTLLPKLAPKLNSTAKPCPCKRTYLPLCASNGQTYNNACAFRCAKQLERSLTVTRKGRCEKDAED
uniref:Kazal-like domain-containing protein n=1 Tax=Anopheles minimus TaxID=112268 RepID=A0A182VUL4_9DIPT